MPLVEVRETIHERETVLEKVVEREVRPEPPRSVDKAATPAHPAAPEAPKVEVHPARPQVLREVVHEVAAGPPPEKKLATARPRDATAPPEETAAGKPRPEERPSPAITPAPLEERAAKAAPVLRHIEPERPRPNQVKPAIAPKEIPATHATGPHLHPAPAREPPHAAVEKLQKRGPAVEVRIGTLEIRASAPAPPPSAPGPVAAAEAPLEDFAAYRSVRRYSAWFRE
jgi:hypothetical protein